MPDPLAGHDDAVAYVERRFGPNWRQVFAFYEFAEALTEDQIVGIRAAYYGQGWVDPPHAEVDRVAWRWMRNACDPSDCPSPTALNGAEPLSSATADMARMVAVRHIVDREVFDQWARPWSETLGGQWLAFLEATDLVEVDSHVE